MGRPPYRRWLTIGLLVIASVWLDTRSAPTELYPMLATDREAGDTVTASDVAYREVPVGLLPNPTRDVVGSVLRQPARAGTPLGDWLITTRVNAPPDSWAVDLAIPNGALLGDPIRIAWNDIDGTRFVDATVLRSGIDGSAAVAAGVAADVAIASRSGQVTVLTLPGR